MRDLRNVRRPVRVLSEQVDVGLDERDDEERRAAPEALLRLIVGRLAEEAAHRQVEPRRQRLIHVQPEVLAVIALEEDEDALLLGVLERHVVVRVAAPLPDRDVVRVERAVRQQVALHVEIHRMRVGTVGNVGDPVSLVGGYVERTNQIACLGDEIPRKDLIAGPVGVRVVGGQVGVRVRDGYELGAERSAVLVPHSHDQLPVRKLVAALGEDLHHSVRGIRPVQGRRRCPLHHLDPLDVLGVDVCEGVVRDRAVHHDQRTRDVG